MTAEVTGRLTVPLRDGVLFSTNLSGSPVPSLCSITNTVLLAATKSQVPGTPATVTEGLCPDRHPRLAPRVSDNTACFRWAAPPDPGVLPLKAAPTHMDFASSGYQSLVYI